LGQLEIAYISALSDGLIPRLNFEVFRRDRMVAALPIGHPLLDRRVLRLMDLASEPFIFLTRAGTPVYYDWLMLAGSTCRMSARQRARSGRIPNTID